jgi:biotin operon repressor
MEPRLLLGTEEGREVGVRVRELVTGRTAVIGQSGSGKSWTVGVICEQLCRLNLGFCVVDPEGEYFSLKEKFQLLWAGEVPPADLDAGKVDLERLFEMTVGENVPVIFDTSGVREEREAVSGLCRALYAVESRLRLPHLLIVEEAEKFLPQRGKPLQELLEISRRGRKRGLGLLLVTQRPAFLSKDVLSQCNNQLIGRLTVRADLEAVSLFFSRREREELPRLGPGEFLVLGSFVEGSHRLKVLPRETAHRGATPELLPRPAGKVSEILRRLGEGGARVPVLPRGEEPPAPAEVPGEVPVFPLGLSREEALRLAESRRKKRILIFGKEERLVGLGLEHHPLILAEVTYPGGLFRRGWRSSLLLLDGRDGRLVDLEEGLRHRPGFEFLLGLEEAQARVLVKLIGRGEAGLPELEAETGMSEATVRRALQGLQEAGLVTHRREGRARIYLPLISRLPSLGERREFSLPPKGKPVSPSECRVGKEDLRRVLKALEPAAEIVRFEVLYYPLYVARYTDRRVVIDGLTGKEVKGPA